MRMRGREPPSSEVLSSGGWSEKEPRRLPCLLPCVLPPWWRGRLTDIGDGGCDMVGGCLGLSISAGPVSSGFFWLSSVAYVTCVPYPRPLRSGIVCLLRASVEAGLGVWCRVWADARRKSGARLSWLRCLLASGAIAGGHQRCGAAVRGHVGNDRVLATANDIGTQQVDLLVQAAAHLYR